MDAYFHFLPCGWPKKMPDELIIYNYYIQHAESNIQQIGSYSEEKMATFDRRSTAENQQFHSQRQC